MPNFSNKKILLIDLDPQANLTMDFAQENIKFKNSLMDIITTKNNIENIEINKFIKWNWNDKWNRKYPTNHKW